MWKKAIKNMVERGEMKVEEANKCYQNIEKGGQNGTRNNENELD